MPETAASTDVVQLILDDDRRMEGLFRRMRSVEAERADALEEFSGLLVAHALAEEHHVHPALKRFRVVEAR